MEVSEIAIRSLNIQQLKKFRINQSFATLLQEKSLEKYSKEIPTEKTHSDCNDAYRS